MSGLPFPEVDQNLVHFLFSSTGRGKRPSQARTKSHDCLFLDGQEQKGHRRRTSRVCPTPGAFRESPEIAFSSTGRVKRPSRALPPRTPRAFRQSPEIAFSSTGKGETDIASAHQVHEHLMLVDSMMAFFSTGMGKRPSLAHAKSMNSSCLSDSMIAFPSTGRGKRPSQACNVRENTLNHSRFTCFFDVSHRYSYNTYLHFPRQAEGNVHRERTSSSSSTEQNSNEMRYFD